MRRVATQDRDRYTTIAEAFLFWCMCHFNLCQDYDALLTAYLNELFAQGADVSAAEYAFAAFRYTGSQTTESSAQRHWPAPIRLSKGTATWLLQRCDSRLLVWALRPSSGPCSREARCSWHWASCCNGTCCCCHPLFDESVGRHLSPVRGGSNDPSKTIIFDESILLSPRVEFLLPVLAALLDKRRAMPLLFDFTCAQLNTEFKNMAALLKLDALEATLRQPPWGRQRASFAGHPAEGDKGSRALGLGLERQKIREGNRGPASGPQNPGEHPALRELCGASTCAKCDGSQGSREQQPYGTCPASSDVLATAQGVRLAAQTCKHLRNLLYHARKQASQHQSQVILELFSGSGCLAKQLRRLGFGVVALDVRNCELEDLCNPHALQVICGWISSGIVLGVWLGTPCTT